MADSGSTSGAGQFVPDYKLVRRIGQGAYGEVWLARSKATGALRAAKIVWRNRFEDERPFRREFEGIQRFEQISREHPSQLALFHIGRNDVEGYFYYVMELADSVEVGVQKSGIRTPETEAGSQTQKEESAAGRDVPIASQQGDEGPPYQPHTLRADLEHGRLPASRVLELGLALTEALAHLHEHGLVHRDVKPSNVIFVNGRPKLADIGLVTDASDQCSIVGTEGYLPPEGPGTPQADIFALGKVLYEGATGMDRREFPKLPKDLCDWADGNLVLELNEIVLKACTGDARQRYVSAETMRDDLALLVHGKSVKRRRSVQWYWALGKKIAVAVGVIAAVVALISFWPRSQDVRSEVSNDGPDSTNLEANGLCDRAMYILRGDDYAEVGIAYTNFCKAIALDPHFARPYVGLLELRVREDVNVPGLQRPVTVGELRSIERHLEQLAPHLAATYVAQSVINLSEQRFPESEHCIQEAIKANPNYEFSYTFYSWLLDCYGRTDEALTQLEIAQRLAPSKVIIYRAFGNTYYVARDYTNAIAWYQKAIQWEPHHYVAYGGIGRCFQAMGNYTNALEYFEKYELLAENDKPATKKRFILLRQALARDGIQGCWTQYRMWVDNDPNASLYWKAQIQIYLGHTNAALNLLQTSYDKHERSDDYQTPLNQLLYDDCWDGLHDNRQFKLLLDRIGFTKVMRRKQ